MDLNAQNQQPQIERDVTPEIDLEKTRMLALSGAIMHPSAALAQTGEAPPGEWSGEELYNYFQENRTARFADDPEGDAQFIKMKEYMKSKSLDVFHGFGDALGMLAHELTGMLNAPKTLLDPNKSLAVSALEGGARGIRFIPSIFWQSEDPTSWIFGLKSWVNALAGNDDGDVRSQKHQFHVARQWNNRTYDYMEGKGTVIGDMVGNEELFNRLVDTEFATGFSWIATDVPSWFLSGGATAVAEGAKLTRMAGAGALAAERARKASYLASTSNRLAEFGTKAAGRTLEAVGAGVQKPFQLLYGARAAAEGAAGSAAAEALHNVAQSQIMAGARVLADGMVHSPGVGLFRSVGIEAIGELMQAAGAELVDRAAGVVPINQSSLQMGVLQKLATNTGSRTQGLLSKEAQTLAKGLNFTVGWIPGFSKETFVGAGKSAFMGGFIGYAHSPDATGGGLGIGFGMGAGHSSLRHLYSYHTYHHKDQAVIKNFGQVGINAITERMGPDTGVMARKFYEHGMSLLEQDPNYIRGLSTDLIELTRLAGDPNVHVGGKPAFFFGDSSPEGLLHLQEWLANLRKENGEFAYPQTAAGAVAIRDIVSAFSQSDGLYLQGDINLYGASHGGHERISNYHDAKRVLLVNKDQYVPGRGAVHEAGHNLLRSAAYNAKNLDPSTGNYSASYMRRFFGATKDEGILKDQNVVEFARHLFAMTGYNELRPYAAQGVPAGTMQVAMSEGSYIRRAERAFTQEGIDLNDAAHHERRKLEMEKALEDVMNERAITDAILELRDDTIQNKDPVKMRNLSLVMDELVQYYQGPRRMFSAPDFFESSKAPKNVLEAVGEYIGERRHASYVADLETSGVRLRGKEDPNAPLFDKNGRFIAEAMFFDADTGEFMKVQGLDDFWRQAVADSEMYSGQAIATLTPAKQEVIAKLSGRTRYFNPVSGGMSLKNDRELREVAANDSAAMFAALEALPEDMKPARTATEKGYSVKLEDIPDAAWDALAKSGTMPAAELAELRGIARVIAAVNSGVEYNNVFECSLAAASRQIGRGATTERLKGKDVPITYRVFSPLSLELFYNTQDAKGNKLKVPEGGIRVHSYDVLALNKRTIGQYSRKEIRQYFKSYAHFADTLYSYIENNSRDAATRIPTEDLFKAEFGKDAARIRDIMFETFGGRKPMDEAYVNVPHDGYRKPGDDRLYPFYTMRWETMSEVRLRPERWNPNIGADKAFPYRHVTGYKPMTTNMMVSGFQVKPKMNGEYLKDHNGYEIHESKKQYKLLDPYGNMIGMFTTPAKAIRQAEKHLEKSDIVDMRPAELPSGDATGLPSSDLGVMRMAAGASSKLNETGYDQKVSTLSSDLADATVVGRRSIGDELISYHSKLTADPSQFDVGQSGALITPGTSGDMALLPIVRLDTLLKRDKVTIEGKDIKLSDLAVHMSDERVFGSVSQYEPQIVPSVSGVRSSAREANVLISFSPSVLAGFKDPALRDRYIHEQIAEKLYRVAGRQVGTVSSLTREDVFAAAGVIGRMTDMGIIAGEYELKSYSTNQNVLKSMHQRKLDAEATLSSIVTNVKSGISAANGPELDIQSLVQMGQGTKGKYAHPETVRATYAIRHDPIAAQNFGSYVASMGVNMSDPSVKLFVESLSRFPDEQALHIKERLGNTSMAAEAHVSDIIKMVASDTNQVGLNLAFLAEMDKLFSGTKFSDGRSFSAGITKEFLYGEGNAAMPRGKGPGGVQNIYASGFERLTAMKELLLKLGFKDGAWSEANGGLWSDMASLVQSSFENDKLRGSNFSPKVASALLRTMDAADRVLQGEGGFMRVIGSIIKKDGQKVRGSNSIPYLLDFNFSNDAVEFYQLGSLSKIVKDRTASPKDRASAMLIMALLKEEDHDVGHMLRGGSGRVFTLMGGVDRNTSIFSGGAYAHGDLPGQPLFLGGKRHKYTRPVRGSKIKDDVTATSAWMSDAGAYSIPLNMNRVDMPVAANVKAIAEGIKASPTSLHLSIEDTMSQRKLSYLLNPAQGIVLTDRQGRHFSAPNFLHGMSTVVPKDRMFAENAMLFSDWAIRAEKYKGPGEYNLLAYANDVQARFPALVVEAGKMLDKIDPALRQLAAAVAMSPDKGTPRAAFIEHLISKGTPVEQREVIMAAADLIVSDMTQKTSAPGQATGLFDVVTGANQIVGKIDFEQFHKVIAFQDSVRAFYTAMDMFGGAGPKSNKSGSKLWQSIPKTEKSQAMAVARANITTVTGALDASGVLRDPSTGTFRMVAGMQGFKELSEERKNLLRDRGLLKTLTLGNGTTHSYFEISDASSEMLFRNFEGRAGKMITRNSSVTPRELATLWLQSNGKWFDGIDNVDPIVAKGVLGDHLGTMNGKSGHNLKLKDILFHPSLYEAYPGLQEIGIRFTNTGRLAAFSAKDNAIHLDVSMMLRDEVIAILSNLDSVDAETIPQYHDSVKMILLHEIQHAVQHAEGWATSMPWLKTVIAGATDEYGRPSLATPQFGEFGAQYGMAGRLLGSEKDTPILSDLRNKPHQYGSVGEMLTDDGRQIYKLPYKAWIWNQAIKYKHHNALADSIMGSWTNWANLAKFSEEKPYGEGGVGPKKESYVIRMLEEATPQQAVDALTEIFNAPKAVRIMQEAVPTAMTYLRSMSMRAQVELAYMGTRPASNAKAMAGLREMIADISTREAEIKAGAESVKAGVISHNQLLDSLGRLVDLQSAHGELAAMIEHPSSAMSGIEAGGMRIPESYMATSSIGVAKRLAEIGIELDKSNISPTRAQLLISRVVDAMSDVFYRDMDIEVMARETSERAFMSESELAATPRRMQFDDPKDSAAYALGAWARSKAMKSKEPAVLDDYNLMRMVGGAGNMPAGVRFEPNNVDLFAVAMRHAARASLNSVFLNAIKPYSSNGILHFSTRGWVYRDGKFFYEISTGRLIKEGKADIRQFLAKEVDGSDVVSASDSPILTAEGKSFYGDSRSKFSEAFGSTTGESIAFISGLSKDGETLTVEDVAKAHGYTIALESSTRTNSPVIEHVVKESNQNSYTGGSIRSDLERSGLDNDSIVAANIDKIDQTFKGVQLSRSELGDLLALVHDVQFESTTLQSNDVMSALEAHIRERGKREVGQAIYISTKDEAAKKMAMQLVVSQILGDGEQWRSYSSYASHISSDATNIARELGLPAFNPDTIPAGISRFIQSSTQQAQMPGALAFVTALHTTMSIRAHWWSQLAEKLDKTPEGQAVRRKFIERAAKLMDDGNDYSGYWIDMPLQKTSKLGAAGMPQERTYGHQPLSAQANAMLYRMQDLLFAVTPAAEKLANRLIKELQGKGMGDDALAAAVFDIVGEYIVGTVEGAKILESTTEQTSNPRMSKAGDIAWQGKKATDPYSAPSSGEVAKTETLVKQGHPYGTAATAMTPGSLYTSLATAAQNYHAFTLSRYSGPAGFMTFDAFGSMTLKGGESAYHLPNILEGAGIKFIPQGDKLSQLAGFPVVATSMLQSIMTGHLGGLTDVSVAIEAHKQSAVASIRLVGHAYATLGNIKGFKDRGGNRFFIQNLVSQMHEASETIARGSVPEGGLALYNADTVSASSLMRFAGEINEASEAGELLTDVAFNDSFAKASAYLRLALDVSDRNMRPGEMQTVMTGWEARSFSSQQYMQAGSTPYARLPNKYYTPLDLVGLVQGYADTTAGEGQKPRMVVTSILEPAIPPTRASMILTDSANAGQQAVARNEKHSLLPQHVKSINISANIFRGESGAVNETAPLRLLYRAVSSSSGRTNKFLPSFLEGIGAYESSETVGRLAMAFGEGPSKNITYARKAILGMTGDSLLHMAEQISSSNSSGRYGISPMSSVEIAELFARADKAMKDPVSRAMALRDDPLLLLLGSKGHEAGEVFKTLKMIPGYAEAFTDSLAAAMSVIMLSQLSDTRRPFYASEGKIMMSSQKSFKGMTPKEILEIHEFVTNREAMPEDRRSAMSNRVLNDYTFQLNNRDGVISLRASSATNDLIRATQQYILSAEGMYRMADMAGYFMAEKLIIPMIESNRNLSMSVKEDLVKAIRYASGESPTAAVHPYVDLAIPGVSSAADSLAIMGLEYGKTGQRYPGSYGAGAAAESMSYLRGLLYPMMEAYVAPHIFSSGAIKALADMPGVKADFNISQSVHNTELAMPRSSTGVTGNLQTVAISPQPLSSMIYEEGRLNPNSHDTGTTSLFKGVLNGLEDMNDPMLTEGGELMDTNMASGVMMSGWRTRKARLHDQDSAGRERTISVSKRYTTGEVVPVEEGGALAAIMSAVNDPKHYDTNYVEVKPTIEVEMPHPVVTEPMIRSNIVKAIADRAARLGTDTVEFAPASETLSRVGPDYHQVVEIAIGGQKLEDAKRNFHARGLKASALASMAWYDSNKAEFGSSERLISVPDTVPAFEGSKQQQQGKGVPSMSDSRHRKGYAWTRLSDGSIMVNISGDHLGYKTATEGTHVSWGFNLNDGVGYDPISKTLAPASYGVQSAISDLFAAVGFESSSVDPHSQVFMKQYMKAAAGQLGTAMSESRKSILRAVARKQINIGDAFVPFVATQGALGPLHGSDVITVSGTGRRSQANIDVLREGFRLESLEAFGNDILEGTSGFKYDPTDGFLTAGMVASAVTSQARPSNYLSIRIPAGATKDVIRRAILDAHLDATYNMAIQAAGQIGMTAGHHMPHLANWGTARSGSGRKYQKHINSGSSTNVNFAALRTEGGIESNIRFALESDPKLLEDVEVLTARIMGEESSYFLPDTERVFASTGDTGAAIATLFPGRPDMLDFSWDAKNAHGIKVWKRSVPKNTDVSKFYAYVVQTDQPVGMTVDGALQIGQKAIAFKTEAQANEFANRLSMNASRASILKAFGNGELEIVDRKMPNAERGSLMPEAVKPAGASLAPLITDNPDMLFPRFWSQEMADDIGMMFGEAKSSSSIGDAVVPYAANSSQAKTLASAINSRKHVRLNTSSIQINRMVSGSTKELEDLVRQKGNFGIPGGAIQYVSKAMEAITHGKMYSNGTWKDFTSLTGIQWYKHLTSAGVTKDEIRQMGLGALLAENKDIALTRYDVAEFFAHMYPTVVRQDINLTDSFMRMNMAYLGAFEQSQTPGRYFGAHMPYSINAENVTHANQMRALKGLADRYNAIKAMLDNPEDPQYGFDAARVQKMRDLKVGFEKLANMAAQNNGIDVKEFTADYTAADMFAAIHGEVLKRSVEGIASRQGISHGTIYQAGSSHILDLRAAAGAAMRTSQYEEFRLNFNAFAKELRDTRIGEELISSAFKDIEPFIRYGVSPETVLMRDVAERRGLSRPVMGTNAGDTFSFDWPGKTSASRDMQVQTSYFTTGQVLHFADYNEYSNYYSLPFGQTSHGVVRFATPEQINEIQGYITSLKTRITMSTDVAEKKRLDKILNAAESALAARMIQKNEALSPGNRHFGVFMQGQIYGGGQYEIGHTRAGQGIITSLVPLEDLSGSNMLGSLGRERAKGRMDLVSMPVTIIEEIQSDLFQGGHSIAEYGGTDRQGNPIAGMSLLPTDPAAPDPTGRFAEIGKLKVKLDEATKLASNAEEAVREEMIRQVMPSNNLSDTSYNGDRIAGEGTPVTANVIRNSLISNFDLVSRIANAPLLSPFMKATGREIGLPAGLRTQLEKLSNTQLPQKLAVFEYDTELVGQVSHVASLIKSNMLVIRKNHPNPVLTALAARVLRSMDSVNAEARRAGWTEIAAHGDGMYKELRKQLTTNPGSQAWVDAYMAAFDTIYKTYSQTAAAQINKEAPALLKNIKDRLAQINGGTVSDNVSRYVETFSQRQGNAEYNLVGIMGLMIMMDTDMNARLSDIFKNPEGYDYEVLARRALENSRRFVSDTRTLVGKTAVTIYEDLLRIPSRERPYRFFGDADYKATLFDTAALPEGNPHLVAASSHERSLLATYERMMRMNEQGTLELDVPSFSSFMYDHLQNFAENRLTDEVRELLIERGIMPDDFTFIIENPENKLGFGSHPMSRPTLATKLDRRSVDQFSAHVASMLQGHTEPEYAAAAIRNLLGDGMLSLFPQHKGSAAGDFAKSVVRSLFEYERSKTALDEATALQKLIAEKEKGLPEVGNASSSISPSVPMIDDAGVAYKKTLFTNAVLDSMAKGQRAVSWLDASWQYSRGGSMMGTDNQIVMGIGPNRLPFRLVGSTTNSQIPAVMAIAHGLFGDDIWSGIASVEEMKADVGLKSSSDFDVRLKNGRFGKRIFTDLVQKVEAKIRELGWPQSAIDGFDNLSGHVLNENIKFERILGNRSSLVWQVLGDDGKPFKMPKDQLEQIQKLWRNASAFFAEGVPFMINNRFDGVPYGYTMNYGLPRAQARMMFLGAPGKLIDAISLDAFDRPNHIKLETENGGTLHRVESGGKTLFELSIMPDEPAEVRRSKLRQVREAIMQNSKYRGSNPYVKGFISDWGPSGGYLDFGFAAGTRGSGLIEGGEYRAQSVQRFAEGQVIPLGDQSMSGYPKLHKNEATPEQLTGMLAKGLLPQVESGAISASPDMVASLRAGGQQAMMRAAAGKYEYMGHGRQTASTAYSFSGNMNDGWWDNNGHKDLIALAHGMTLDEMIMAFNNPVVTTFVHTPEFRDAKQLKAYQERVTKGYPLMMISGSLNPDLNDKATRAQIASFMKIPYSMRSVPYSTAKDDGDE